METDGREALLQNLRDAGCGERLIQRFLACRDSDRKAESLRLLAVQRTALLDEMHASQARLDCLDFLINQLRKENETI